MTCVVELCVGVGEVLASATCVVIGVEGDAVREVRCDGASDSGRLDRGGRGTVA